MRYQINYTSSTLESRDETTQFDIWYPRKYIRCRNCIAGLGHFSMSVLRTDGGKRNRLDKVEVPSRDTSVSERLHTRLDCWKTILSTVMSLEAGVEKQFIQSGIFVLYFFCMLIPIRKYEPL